MRPLDPLMQEALPVIRKLESGGFEAVFVGGCVRDSLMGRPLADIDIATSALPEQVAALFPRTLPTGLRHGTVTVRSGGRTCEVTTYRVESGYHDHRRPSEVEFVDDLTTDLMRRDFTINAIAMRADGTVVDPFGGIADLKRRVIRCVGDPEERFREDALRMLRAIRFASVFGFRLAFSVWKALVRCRELLRHIAMERIRAELEKIMAGPDPGRGLALLTASGLAAYTKEPLPEALRAAKRPDPGSPLARCAGGLSQVAGLSERLAALFMMAGASPEDAASALKTLRFPKAETERIVSVVRLHAMTGGGRPLGEPAPVPENPVHSASRTQWIDAVLACGAEAADGWLSIAGACRLVPSDVQAQRRTWLKELPAASVRELAVGGADLIRRLGLTAGPAVGRLLDKLLREVAYGRLPNEREALLEQAETWNKNRGD